MFHGFCSVFPMAFSPKTISPFNLRRRPWNAIQVPWASSGSSGSCVSSRCQVSPGAHCLPCCWIRSGLEDGRSVLFFWGWDSGCFWWFWCCFMDWDSGFTFTWFSHLDSENSQSWVEETNLPLFGRVYVILRYLGSAYGFLQISPSEWSWMKLNVAVSVEVKS